LRSKKFNRLTTTFGETDFIFTSYACILACESKQASLIERLKETYDSI